MRAASRPTSRDRTPSSSPERVSGTRNNRDGDSPTPPFPKCCLSWQHVSTMPPWKLLWQTSWAGARKTENTSVRNALQRLGSPAYISGAGSLGSCWGLWFPGMESLGGVGGAAGDFNNCTWVVSSDTCATNTCTARPVFNIFILLEIHTSVVCQANSSCKPRVSAESMKIGSDPSVTMKTEDSVAEKESLLQEVYTARN